MGQKYKLTVLHTLIREYLQLTTRKSILEDRADFWAMGSQTKIAFEIN